jgi:hypothetical protein
MHQNRIYRRNTIGENTRVFIAKGIEYTTESTFQDFVTSGLDGEIGVFKVLSTHTHDGEATLQAVVLAAGMKFFVAQIQVQADGERLVKKTPVATFEDISNKRKEAFCLPVAQVSSIGYNGTDGDIATVVTSVLVGDIYSVSIMETTEGYQPFPTWNYEYQAISGDDLQDVVAGIVKQINNTSALQVKENPAVVKAEMITANTPAAIAGTVAVVNGSTTATFSAAHGLVAGEYAEIGGVTYKIASISSTTVANLDTPYQGATDATLAGSAEVGTFTATGINITATETQLTFRVTAKEKLKDVLLRVTTDMKYGSGFREDVSYIEREGQIFDGTTTVNAAYRDEHGRQMNYALSTSAYDYFHLDFLKRFESKGYKNSEDTQYSQVLIAAPMTAAPGGDYSAVGASPIDELVTIFGL